MTRPKYQNTLMAGKQKMLGKLNRITRDKDFKKIFKRSKKIETENLIFRVNERKTQETRNKDTNNIQTQKLKQARGPRFGFVVSNKINKRATRRNALKRRLRAGVRELLPTLLRDIDAIILVKKDFPSPYNYQDIKKQVIEGLGKLT